jgi:hypothetical protein
MVDYFLRNIKQVFFFKIEVFLITFFKKLFDDYSKKINKVRIMQYKFKIINFIFMCN